MIFPYLYLGLGLEDDGRNAGRHEKRMTEEWRPVSGYEGLYEVSNLGVVRSLDMKVRARGGAIAIRKGRVLETSVVAGYDKVCLSVSRKKEYKLVHRLVALAFLEPREGANCVNHKDLNKRNNSANNLEWVTYSENNKHAHDAGAYSYGNNLARVNPKISKKLTLAQVNDIREMLANGELQRVIADKHGVSQCMISCIKRDKTWRSPREVV